MEAQRPLAENLKIELAARLGAATLWLSNLVCRRRVLTPVYAERRRAGQDVRCVYAVWHGNLWHMAYVLRHQGVHALVSSHRDGEIIARILRRLGFELVRGSSTRGGARALRDMARVARDGQGDLVVTIDGPKGPARQVKDGILFAASRSGLPIVPVGMWVARGWRAASWDRMVIGKPLSRVAVALGDEIRIPPDVDRNDLLARYGPVLGMGMDAAEAQARRALEPNGGAR
jgi:lysophospholipid acyltransferase (LPLAT)-like uncharacterized protein